MDTIADNFEEALILALENWSPSSVLQSEASSVVIKVTHSDKGSATIIMLRGISCSRLPYGSAKAFPVDGSFI